MPLTQLDEEMQASGVAAGSLERMLRRQRQLPDGVLQRTKPRREIRDPGIEATHLTPPGPPVVELDRHRVGTVICAAAGSSKVNAAIYDAYGRPVLGTMSSDRRVLGPLQPTALAEELASRLTDALRGATSDDRHSLRAVAIAPPFASLTTDMAQPIERDGPFQQTVHARLVRAVPALRSIQDWLWVSDVAAEGAFEYCLEGEPAVGRSPAVIIKISRNARASILVRGQPWRGVTGADTVNVGSFPLHRRSDKAGTVEELISLRAIAGRLKAGDPQYKSLLEQIEADRDHTDAELWTMHFEPRLKDRQLQEAFQQIGRFVGLALEQAFLTIDPAVVVLTGFIARAERSLIDGIREACEYTLRRGATFEIASGIHAESKGLVIEPNQSRRARTEVMPWEELPQEFRVGSGAAQLAANHFLAPDVDAILAAVRSKIGAS